MTKEMDAFAYMMAAEKVVNLIFLIEQMMIFMEEYSIEPDEEVKKALAPEIEKLKNWIK